jgi:uncharacterized protein YndB with AHSA1/START domain
VTDLFIAQRRYAVQPDVLFAAWTNVSTLSRWFGCGDDMLWTVHAWDVREGGAIKVSLDFGGKPYEVGGEFLVVDAPRHLRYRWNSDQIVDVAIEPCADGSLLTLKHSWPPTDDDRSMLDAGWKSALEQLEPALRAEATP